MTMKVANTLEELHKLAEDGLMSRAQLSNDKSWRFILKLYDKGMHMEEIGDYEQCYVYLFRFVNNSMQLRKSSLYMKDPKYIDALISTKKISKALNKLEPLKEKLRGIYAPKSELVEKGRVLDETEQHKREFSNDFYELKARGDGKITPRELISLIRSNKHMKFLVIDIRNEPTHAIDFTLCNHTGICVINIPLSLINRLRTTGVVLWSIEKELQNDVLLSNALKNRKQFHAIILFGKNSSDNTELYLLKDAFYKFDSMESEPFILEGGWDEWCRLYPPYKRLIEVSTQVPITNTPASDVPIAITPVSYEPITKTPSTNSSPTSAPIVQEPVPPVPAPRRSKTEFEQEKNQPMAAIDLKNHVKPHQMLVTQIIPKIDRSLKPKAYTAQQQQPQQNIKLIYSDTGISNFKNNVTIPIVDRSVKPNNEMLNERKRLSYDQLNPIWSPTRAGLTGIRNLGNTCYMNSIIQCLVNTPYLRDYFAQSKYMRDLNRENVLGSGGRIAEEFSLLVKALWSGECKVIMPKKFKHICGQFSKMFDNNDQHDAQEFLMILLDALHEDLNRVRVRPKSLSDQETTSASEGADEELLARKSWSRHLTIHNSIIVEQFQGLTKSHVTCLTCGHSSTRFDAFMYLQVPIPKGDRVTTLNDCLNEYCHLERIDWFCVKCKRDQMATQQITLWSLPNLLIVHLKRFSFDGPWRNKLNTLVYFPASMSTLSIRDSKSTCKYKLYAVCNHVGTLNGGHYTAMCLNSYAQKWFKFDDQDVYEIENDLDASGELKQLKTNQAYILFYSKI